MKRSFQLGIVAIVFLFSCNSKHSNFSNQVKANFISHVYKIDSTLALDSFTVLSVDTINRRMERIIDDTLYMMEFYRIQQQLTNAKKGTRPDSIEFYQGEVNYMQSQFDSLTREIRKADTTKKLGLLATCKVQLTKDGRSGEMVVYYFLDWNMKVWNPEMIDTAISGLSARLVKN